jgi:hypothetical protein
MIGVGLEVESKFDGGNSDWLASDAGGREWAVGYHGIRWSKPEEIIGKIVKDGFKSGAAQAKRGSKDTGANKEVLGEYCGEGIYLAPRVEINMG